MRFRRYDRALSLFSDPPKEYGPAGSLFNAEAERDSFPGTVSICRPPWAARREPGLGEAEWDLHLLSDRGLMSPFRAVQVLASSRALASRANAPWQRGSEVMQMSDRAWQGTF